MKKGKNRAFTPPSRPSRRDAPRIFQLFPLIGRVQHFASVAAVVGADNAVLGHEVNEASGPAVADAKCTLQQRNTAAAFADDDLDRLFVNLVAGAQTIPQAVATAIACC